MARFTRGSAPAACPRSPGPGTCEGGPEDLPYDELIWIATEPYRAAGVCVDPEQGRAWIGIRGPHVAGIYWHELLHPENWGEKREEELVHTLIHELADQEHYLRVQRRLG